MQEVGYDSAERLFFAKVDDERCVLTFPSDPALHVCRSAEQSVGDGSLAQFGIFLLRRQEECHLCSLRHAFLFLRKEAFAVELAVVCRFVVAFVKCLYAEVGSALLEKVEQCRTGFVRAISSSEYCSVSRLCCT